jgi:hypothetical protein
MKQTVNLLIIGFILVLSCTTQPDFQPETVDKAIENGKQANEGFARSLKFVEGWMTKTDSVTGLIPTNLTRSSDIWEPHNSLPTITLLWFLRHTSPTKICTTVKCWKC